MEDNNYENNMVFGIHPVQEVMAAGKEIEKVFIQAGMRVLVATWLGRFGRVR